MLLLAPFGRSAAIKLIQYGRRIGKKVYSSNKFSNICKPEEGWYWPAEILL